MTSLLYVDDEESIGRVVSRYFERRGDQVFLARTIAEAQAVLGDQDPDVLFVDVWLGNESGYALRDWVQRHKPELAGRIVFVTGDDVAEGRPGSADGRAERPIIRKPFEMADLQRIVDAERRATE